MDERACTCFECKRIREEFYEKLKRMLLKAGKIRIIDSLTLILIIQAKYLNTFILFYHFIFLLRCMIKNRNLLLYQKNM